MEEWGRHLRCQPLAMPSFPHRLLVVLLLQALGPQQLRSGPLRVEGRHLDWERLAAQPRRRKQKEMALLGEGLKEVLARLQIKHTQIASMRFRARPAGMGSLTWSPFSTQSHIISRHSRLLIKSS